MTYHNFENGDRFAAHSRQTLSDAGIELTVGTDFEQYREVLAEARPDHILGDPFEPNKHVMNATNSAWIAGRNADGKLVHTQAMRMVDMKGRRLSDYLRHNFRDFPPSGLNIDMQRSRLRPGPGALRIAGNVCYHGEYWLGDIPRVLNGEPLSNLLGRYAFWEAMTRFDPDYVFGFMEKTVVHKGFPARHAYMHTEPGTLRWYIHGNPTPIEGYLTYMERDDLRFVLDLPLREEQPQSKAA